MTGTTQTSSPLSPDQLSIARLVPQGSRVLDLGCGTGALLDHLIRERGCSGYGVEIDDANVQACVARGVNVIQFNLEDGLALFGDNSFDVVLQIDTLRSRSDCAAPLRSSALAALSRLCSVTSSSANNTRTEAVPSRAAISKKAITSRGRKENRCSMGLAGGC